MTSDPQLFQVWSVSFAVVSLDIDQELIGSGLTPQSTLWLSRKCADLEGFSDVVNNQVHTVKCFLFQPVFGIACA